MPSTPYRIDDAFTRTQARSAQKWETVWLDADQAMCVAQTLIDATRSRDWRILRAAVMANHTHVVIIDCPDDGPGVRRILKGNSQAALSDRLGENRRWWTQGGSNRYLHGTDAIEAAMRYVADQVGILAEIIDMTVSGPRRYDPRDPASGGA